MKQPTINPADYDFAKAQATFASEQAGKPESNAHNVAAGMLVMLMFLVNVATLILVAVK